uniref:type II secretion system protein GspD n=1 Tax=Paraphotobacterium marinum TaxID=1755811 RepID=UPI00384C780B
MTANPETMKQLKSIVAQLDIRRAQVHVEALIVELDENSLKELGVQMGATQGSFTQFSSGANSLPFVNYYIGAEALNNGDNGVAAATLGSARGLVLGGVWNDWAVVLNALQQTSNSNIISAPNFTVLDNAEGVISVGEEVPILTGQTLSDDNSNPFNTFERKDVGTKLTVTPQINEGDSVQLKLEQEILRVVQSNASVGLQTFRTKKLSTSVLIKSGSMIVLGGLIEDREVDSNQKVPVLGDIPVLGALFRGSNSSKTKENTMIFLKPTIIRDDISADGLAQRKYNYLRADQLYNQVFNDSILKQKILIWFWVNFQLLAM